MHYLIPLVMAIGLSSLVTWSIVSILPSNSQMSEHFQETLSEGLDSFKYAVEEYRKVNSSYSWTKDCPDADADGFPDTLHPDCVYVQSGRVDGTLNINGSNWQSHLIPDYLFPPKTPRGWELGEWKVDRNATGLYVCAEGVYNDISARGLQLLLADFSGSAFKIGGAGNCGMTGASLGAIDIGAYAGSKMTVTYYIGK